MTHFHSINNISIIYPGLLKANEDTGCMNEFGKIFCFRYRKSFIFILQKHLAFRKMRDQFNL